MPVIWGYLWEPFSLWQIATGMILSLLLVTLARPVRGSLGSWSLVLGGLRWLGGLLGLIALANGVWMGIRQFLPELMLSLEPIWPWPMMVLCGVGLPILVLGYYSRKIGHLGQFNRRLLLVLRLMAAGILYLLLWRPTLLWDEQDRERPLFLIAVDSSRSMNTADGPGGISRHEYLTRLLEEHTRQLNGLTKKLDLQFFEFDQSLKPMSLSEKRAPQAQGMQTPIGDTLEKLIREGSNRRIAGILLMGDGAQRALPPLDRDPRIVTSSLVEKQIRVNTLAVGSAKLAGLAMDLSVEDMQVNPTVFVKNEVIVGSSIRTIGASGRELVVRLLVETPQLGAEGQEIKFVPVGVPKRITPNSGEEVTRVELSFSPEFAGEFKVGVEVIPIEGEVVTTNNIQTTFLNVLRGGVNVAFFDQTRPEILPVRKITESPEIQLDFKEIRFGKRFQKFKFEPEWFAPGRYDVYIIGSVPARAFEQQDFPQPVLEMMRAAVERGAGLMMIGGYRSFGPGGYGNSPLQAALPVILDPAQTQIGDGIDEQDFIFQNLPMVPTALGMQHYVMRLDTPEKNRQAWLDLPPLEVSYRFGKLKPQALPLAAAPDGTNLLVAQDYGRGRTMAFAGFTTFQWPLAGFGDRAAQFWRQQILWLAHKEDQSDSPLWLKLGERRLRPGQPLELTAGVRTKEGRPMMDAEVKMTILGPGQEGDPESKEQVFQVPLQKSEQDWQGKFNEALEPGEYRARFEASQNGKPLGLPIDSRFIVYEHDLEMQNPIADLALMEEIARTTGGKAIPGEEFGDFLESLDTEDWRQDSKTAVQFRIWDHWLLLILFVSIMTVEWFVRKSRGLV